MKKRNLLLVGLGLSVLALSSCNNSGRVDMSKWKFTPADSNNIKIGILQPVEHDALALARDSFKETLNNSGFKVTFNYQNANGVEADQVSMAKTLVDTCDMTLGIGTGASTALQSAAINSGKTNPILFTAVTDAVSAKLVDSNENPGQFITGTSDANPVEAQIELIKQCIPTATKMGIIYTQSEINSEVQANQAKAAATKEGLSVEIETCTDSSDIASVANKLCSSGIQALYIPTDNNIAAHMTPVKNALDQFHVLAICGETSICKSGGGITLSVNYSGLGKATAELAIKIFNGSKPCDLAVSTQSKEQCEYVYSSKNISDANITLPADIIAKCTDCSAE